MRERRIQTSIGAWILAILLLLTGCGSSSSPGAGGNVSPDGLDVPLGPGEVRAGQITRTSELLTGPRAAGMIGDYKIYNARAAFVIRSPENPPVGWIPYSGTLIDADRTRAPGEAGQDCLWDYAPFFGILRGFMGTSVEVIRADSPAGETLIRVRGQDAGLPLIDSVFPTPDYDLEIVQDYVLEPDVPYLTIRTTIRNTRPQRRRILLGDLPLWADKLSNYAPWSSGDDLDAHKAGTALPYAAGINRIGLPISYALAPPSPAEPFLAPYIDTELFPLITASLWVEAEGSVSVERAFILSDGGTGTVEGILDAVYGRDRTGTLEGTVPELPVEGIAPEALEVHVTSEALPADANHAGLFKPDPSGAFSGTLPAGAYRVVARGEPDLAGTPVPVEIVAGERARVTLDLPRPAVLRYEVIEAGGGPVPCKIVLQTGFDAPPDAPHAHLIWSADGEGLEPIPPGAYTVTAARGYEYEIVSRNLQLEAGREDLFTATLERSVDTSGFLSGDFHIHSEFSVDSQTLAEHRVRCLASEGIEMPVFTDHDFCADYTGIVRQMGMAAYLTPVRGNEVSPTFGHMNVWPLTPPPGAPAYFGIPLVEHDAEGVRVRAYEFPEIWAVARRDFGAQIVQINHPRSDSSGWFASLGYDRSRGVGWLDPERWSPDFDAVEVFNSGTWDEDFEETLPDWFSFLNQGLAYTATGNSDTHTPRNTSGYPRNLFAMPTDDPAAADPRDMVTAILAHRNVVSGGPFLRFEESAGGRIGDTVTTRAGAVTFRVRVEAPTWMEVDTVRIVANGEVVRTLSPVPDGVVRLDETVTFRPDRDTWYVVLAVDTLHALGPVNPGERIFAMTNPIWVDADGSGAFDPPGLDAP